MSTPTFPASNPDLLANLKSRYNLVRVTPTASSELEYSLILPIGWVNAPDLGEQNDAPGELVKIGLFLESGAPGAAIVQVFFSRIPSEIGVRDWLEHQAEKFGLHLTHCQEEISPRGPVVDAGGLYGPPEDEYVMRIVGHAEGKNIFLATAMVPRARYDSMQNAVAIATHSFKLLSPLGAPDFEPILGTSGGDPAFHVVYPSSWISRPVQACVPGKSGVDIYLPENREMLAYLRVKAIDPGRAGAVAIESLLADAVDEMAEAGVTLNSNWRPDETINVERVESPSGLFVAKGQLQGNALEVRFGVLMRQDLVFAITLLSPPRDEKPVLWMRSKRAYEIALASVRPVMTGA